MLLSLFSFFEAFVKDVVQEMFDFHGGAEKLLEIAEKRDRYFSSLPQQSEVANAKSKLRTNKVGKEQRYAKFGIILRDCGYRFPTDRMSSYGVRMLIERHKKLRAHDIPDLLEHGLSIPVSQSSKDKFYAIKDKRNKVAHGRMQNLDLSYIREANDFFRDMTFLINSHILEDYFVVEEYAYP